MKRNTRTLLFLAGMLLAAAGSAHAAPYTDTQDFSGDGTYDGATYQEINAGLLTPFAYNHTLNLVPPGLRLDSGTLEITHMGNRDNMFLELWWVGLQENYHILPTVLGTLSRSTSGWVTDSFTLSNSILESITWTDPWRLEIRLAETTLGTDYLRLDKSVLRGEYTAQPVPEPGSLLLLGSGLVGMAGMRLRGWRRSGAA